MMWDYKNRCCYGIFIFIIVDDGVLLLSRYPDEEAGQIPMAFVVRKPGSKITEAQVMEFIAKQACF